jgi:sugar transferase (PEP-CTERM/EpsH1 system associated)
METELTPIPELSEPVQSSSPLQSKPAGESPRSARQKLRVMHLFNYLGLGGTELAALRMIRRLDPSLFENQICGIRGFDPSVVAVHCPRAIVLSLPSGRPDSRSQIFSLSTLFKDYRPHVVHSRNWGTIEGVPAAWLAGVPVVIHSEHGYEMDALASLPFRRRLFRRAIHGMTSAVFTVTGELKQFHARQAWVSPSRIRVIPNGIDTDAFSPRPDLRVSTRLKLRVPAERFVIGSVGRLVPIKDHLTLIRAAEKLVLGDIDVHVLLAGDGPELARYQEFLANSPTMKNRVSFLGACDNVSEILNALDVFVLPSISEGMSNTLIEAMACELSVVATRVGGNPEVVGNELSGNLFTPGDINGLAECLDRLARNLNLRRMLGSVARQRAVSFFSLERMVGDYQRLYLEFAEARGLCPKVND